MPGSSHEVLNKSAHIIAPITEPFLIIVSIIIRNNADAQVFVDNNYDPRTKAVIINK
jgi:hypothetical protein